MDIFLLHQGPHGYNPQGITPISFDVPDKNEILPCYPNPSNYMTNIPYNISTKGLVIMEIYSITGKNVTTLINNELQPGKYKAEFFTSKLPIGNLYLFFVCKWFLGLSND